MKRILLASSSPRRIELLRKFNIDFDIVPSSYEEKLFDTDPISLAIDMAKGKALDVAKKT